MKKILLAINNKEAEKIIQEQIKDVYEVVGVVSYKDAVPSALLSSAADTLLIREELAGSVDFLKFIKSIRSTSSMVRIICIVKERENRRDPFLAALVSLGIYDIINKDSVYMPEIISYILHPRTFGDVVQYYDGVPDSVVDEIAEPQTVKKKTLFGGGKSKKDKPSNDKTSAAPIMVSINDSKTVNVETMRTAIEEEATRKAQKNVEKIAAEMTAKQTEAIKKEIGLRDNRIAELTSNLNMKIAKEVSDSQSIKDKESEITRLNDTLKNIEESYKNSTLEYENKIKALSSTETSDWYKNKVKEIEENYQREILKIQEELKTTQKQLDETKQNLKDRTKNLSQSLQEIQDKKTEAEKSAILLKTERDNLQKTIEHQKEQLKTATSESGAEKFATINEQLKEMAALVEKTKAEKVALLEKIESQESELSAVRQDTSNANAIIQTLDSKTSELTQTIDSLTQEKDKILQNVSDKEQTINALNVQITEKDHLVHEFEQKIAEINKNIQELNLEKDALVQKLDAQAAELTAAHQEVTIANNKKAAVEKQVESLESEVESLQTKPKDIAVVNGRFDLSGNPDTMVVLPDDNSNYTEAPSNKTKTFMFIGGKHGTGTSTIALNTATALALRGYKTLYMEFNDKYPMVSEFFEFIDIRSGIDTALAGIADENKTAIDAAIIKPRGILSDKKPLMEAYMKMPEALHCMFFTNAYLNRIRCGGTNKIDTTHMKELFSYLLNDLKYSYIVVDIQADNEIGQFFLANADTFADKLLITCTQDPHSVVTAGMLLNDLRSEYKSDVIDNSRIIINRFSSTSPVTIPKIAKWLRLPPKKFYKISEDRDGYQKAEMSAIPYVVGKGQYFKEYMTLGVVF